MSRVLRLESESEDERGRAGHPAWTRCALSLGSQGGSHTGDTTPIAERAPFLVLFFPGVKGKSSGLPDRRAQVCRGARGSQIPWHYLCKYARGGPGRPGGWRALAPARLKVILSPAGLITLDLRALSRPGGSPSATGGSRLHRKRSAPLGVARREVNSDWRPRASLPKASGKTHGPTPPAPSRPAHRLSPALGLGPGTPLRFCREETSAGLGAAQAGGARDVERGGHRGAEPPARGLQAQPPWAPTPREPRAHHSCFY